MKTNSISDVWIGLVAKEDESMISFMTSMRSPWPYPYKRCLPNYNPSDIFKTPTFAWSFNISFQTRVISDHREIMFITMTENEKKKTLWEKIKPFVPKPCKIKTTSKKYQEGDKGVFGLGWTIKW